jgi:hypothetical protein
LIDISFDSINNIINLKFTFKILKFRNSRVKILAK